MRPLLAALAKALTVLSFTVSVAAQQPSDLERAKASFKAGANAYAAGDYLAAIQALETAYELSPLPAIAFSLAQAERKQYFVKEERAHLERAVMLFRRYLEQEPRGGRREDARLALTQLEPLLGATRPAEAPSKQPQRPTRLMIVSEAPGAVISLDDQPAAASPLIREVTPGKHRARVRAAGYVDAEREVTAVAGELLLTEVRLTERPSVLYVWAPLGSDIYVDGVYVGAGGERMSVPLAAGAHQLSVLQKGRRMVRRDLQIERGRTHTEQVTLEPTTQRMLSEFLFIGGGGALGASLVLSALAIRSENKAEQFLGDRRQHSVSAAQLVAYDASLVERNRYRTAAVISVAGSVGMFITGLFLHELDRPSALGAASRSSAPRPQTALSRFRFAPVAAASDVGASLQMSF
jgi:tetratricopeptide (TPR) repeat protein